MSLAKRILSLHSFYFSPIITLQICRRLVLNFQKGFYLLKKREREKGKGKRKRGKKKKKSGEKKGKKKGDKHTHTNCSVACEQGMGAEREE